MAQKTTSRQFQDAALSVVAAKHFNVGKLGFPQTVRTIGQRCFSYAPTDVWGFANGAAQSKNEQPVLFKSRAMELLTDEQIQTSQSLLVLGFGAGKPGYGAGPTRDMRRAFYTPIVLATLEKVELGKINWGIKSVSPFVKELSLAIETLDLSSPTFGQFSSHNPTSSLFSSNVRVNGQKFGADIFISNVSKTGGHVLCDINIYLVGKEISGQAFLPPDAAATSPLFSSLAFEVGGQEALMGGPAKQLNTWLFEQCKSMKSIVDKVVKNSPTTPMVHVYNS